MKNPLTLGNQSLAIKESADAMGLEGEIRKEYEANPTKWIDENLDCEMLGETRALLDGSAERAGKQVANTAILIGAIMLLIGLISYTLNPIELHDSPGFGLAICGLVFVSVGGLFRKCF